MQPSDFNECIAVLWLLKTAEQGAVTIGTLAALLILLADLLGIARGI